MPYCGAEIRHVWRRDAGDSKSVEVVTLSKQGSEGRYYLTVGHDAETYMSHFPIEEEMAAAGLRVVEQADLDRLVRMLTDIAGETSVRLGGGADTKRFFARMLGVSLDQLNGKLAELGGEDS